MRYNHEIIDPAHASVGSLCNAVRKLPNGLFLLRLKTGGLAKAHPDQLRVKKQKFNFPEEIPPPLKVVPSYYCKDPEPS